MALARALATLLTLSALGAHGQDTAPAASRLEPDHVFVLADLADAPVPEAAPALAQLEELYDAYVADRAANKGLAPDELEGLGWLAVEYSLLRTPRARRDLALNMLARAAADLARQDALQIATDVEVRYAYLLTRAGRTAEARQRLRARLPALERHREGAAAVLLQLSECEFLGGDFVAADEYVERARSAVAEARAGDRPGLQLTAASLEFTLAIGLGLPDHAARALAHERDLVDGVGPEDIDEARAQYELHVAQAAAARDDHRNALTTLSALLATPGLDAETRAMAIQMSGLMHAELAHTDDAELALAVAALEESVRDAATPEPARWLAELTLADVERRRGRRERAADWLALGLERRARAGAAETASNSAAFAVVEAELALANGATGPALAAQLDAMESAYDEFLEAWSNVPKRRDGVAFLHYGARRAVVGAVVELTLAVHGAERGAELALEQLLRAQALGSLSRALGGDSVSLAEARRALCGDRSGVLVYLPGPERSYVFACDSTRVTCTRLAASRSWAEPRREWFSLLSRPPAGDDAERAARFALYGGQLAAALLPSEVLARIASWDTVAIVGIDLLGYVPFEALPAGPDRRFGLSYASYYLPSLAVGAQLARRASAQGSSAPSLLLLAAPTDPAGAETLAWDTIAWDESHAAPLRAIYGAGGVDVAVREAASLAALANASSYGALQIVAHGFYEHDAIPPPGIALAPCESSDGWVRCADIERLALPPVVALAVCGAGRGVLRSGDDGVTNLGGACFRGGARVVLLSPVDLEQTSTELLLAHFHRMLTGGATPAAAMLAARRELAAEARYADPYYFATLQVVGLGGTPAFAPRGEIYAPTQPRKFTWLWVVASLSAAAVAVLVCLRRRPRSA